MSDTTKVQVVAGERTQAVSEPVLSAAELMREQLLVAIEKLQRSGKHSATIEEFVNMVDGLTEQQAKQLTAELKRLFGVDKKLHLEKLKGALNSWDVIGFTIVTATIYGVGAVGTASPEARNWICNFGGRQWMQLPADAVQATRIFQKTTNNAAQVSEMFKQLPQMNKQAQQEEHRTNKGTIEEDIRMIDSELETQRSKAHQALQRREERMRTANDHALAVIRGGA